MSSDRFEKGSFSEKRFPVAKEYVRESGRGPLFLAGAIAALVVAAVFLGDAFLGRATTVAHGPLSASHALFGTDCASCHTAGEGAVDENCATCHEKVGTATLGAYSFDRHYLYRSGDPDRSAPSTSEVDCAVCHQEHRGRDASLVSTSDATCLSCHDGGSFPGGHPEFEFAAEELPDPANLRFPHVLHVNEVADEHDLGSDLEATCLQCHTPEPDGRGFEPVSFEQQCDQCHLNRSSSTPWLPVASDGGPGVHPLTAIQASGAPGTQWSRFWNPNEFTELDGEIRKQPLYHEDPWVLYNLRRLRRQLYPGAELADLLAASADVESRESPALPAEAANTLREWIRALQGTPSRELQDELAGMSELLDAVEERLDEPLPSVDVTRYEVGLADRASDLESADEYRTVVDSLTSECRTCHVVERATLRRVQKDQRTLDRAEFDHRAHVTHARCLDCHSSIPVREAAVQDEYELPASQDRAEIQNLPTVETCATCHDDRAAPNECTSCHVFHPDRAHWANLSRYEGREP